MNSIIYFGCGIGFAYLLKALKTKKSKDFKCGDEDVCSNCKFHSVVIDSISEVETNGNDWWTCNKHKQSKRYYFARFYCSCSYTCNCYRTYNRKGIFFLEGVKMNNVVEIMSLFPYGFGAGFIIYTCLSLLSIGIYKAIGLLNFKAWYIRKEFFSWVK